MAQKHRVVQVRKNFPIELSEDLDDFINYIFNKGGHSSMQIVDVLEWLPSDQFTDERNAALEIEADGLRQAHGDFYLFCREQ